MDDLDTSTGAVKLSTSEWNFVPGSDIRLSNDHDDDDDEWCDEASDLDRLWHQRRAKLHPIGYRDGFIAGKEASGVEGFTDGFKQSVLVGYKWGLVRGVTSAFSCLPTDLKEKLAGTIETKDKLQNLRENVCAISTRDAFQIFHDEILQSELSKQREDFEGNSKFQAAIKWQGTFKSLNCSLSLVQQVRLHKTE
ncbi:hypothetical protein Scep_023690 [Stephania cephalantha]|uniref:Essential protein Yae1 N-terminal domain-containing protein n=1 Tax=Stephania cephalantha TaxID=152367 RepID=A0AAP0HXQ8_9MAGN